VDRGKSIGIVAGAPKIADRAIMIVRAKAIVVRVIMIVRQSVAGANVIMIVRRSANVCRATGIVIILRAANPCGTFLRVAVTPGVAADAGAKRQIIFRERRTSVRLFYWPDPAACFARRSAPLGTESSPRAARAMAGIG